MRGESPEADFALRNACACWGEKTGEWQLTESGCEVNPNDAGVTHEGPRAYRGLCRVIGADGHAVERSTTQKRPRYEPQANYSRGQRSADNPRETLTHPGHASRSQAKGRWITRTMRVS